MRGDKKEQGVGSSRRLQSPHRCSIPFHSIPQQRLMDSYSTCVLATCDPCKQKRNRFHAVGVVGAHECSGPCWTLLLLLDALLLSAAPTHSPLPSDSTRCDDPTPLIAASLQHAHPSTGIRYCWSSKHTLTVHSRTTRAAHTASLRPRRYRQKGVGWRMRVCVLTCSLCERVVSAQRCLAAATSPLPVS